MDKKETKKFMERIKSHYETFVVDEFKFSEWYGYLKQYDAEDVNKKLDEHLNSEIYGRNIPMVSFLTKYLIPSDQKGVIRHHTVICGLCGQAVFDDDYENHYSRCSSATTICRDLKRYLNQNIDYQKLIELSNEKFENLYRTYLNKMLEAPLPDFRKKIILRCVYPNYELSISELFNDMFGKKEENENE